jgi:hypothetical protein
MTGAVRLRGHHLGCVQGFTGHGYDGPFTARLAAIAGALRADPTAPVVLADGADDVCEACPHFQGSVCAREPGAETRVRAHDAAFRAALGIAALGTVAIADVASFLALHMESRESLRIACSGCPWTGDCSFFARLKG